MTPPVSGFIMLMMCANQATAAPAHPRRAVVHAQAAPACVWAQAGGAGQPIQVKEPEALPKYWIGVRTSPIPEPLAAHIGSHGLMIVNVAKDSPADRAGLERYDVIVSFAGEQIEDMSDLLKTVGDSKPDAKTELAVIRKGEKQTLSITPVNRPDMEKLEYKYEEPQDNPIDRSLNLRGMMMQRGPGGNWTWQELGPLGQLPDVLKHLDTLDLRGFAPGDIDVRVFGGPDDADADTKARVETTVRADENGEITTVERDADGKIHFERLSADGKKTSETYENLDEFREKHPEACKLYQRYANTGTHVLMLPSAPDQLDKARQHFQVEVQRKLENAAKRAQDQADKAQQQATILRERVERINKAQDGGGKTVHSLSVKVAEDGKITVTTGSGDDREVYIFESKEDFKKSQPDLYEKVKDWLE